MAVGSELLLRKAGSCSLEEEMAKVTLRGIRNQGHPYVELRENGKRFTFFCTLCLSPCYGETTLLNHLKGNLHTQREFLVSAVRDGDLQEAKALLEYNPRLARYSTLDIRNSPLHYSAAQGYYEIVSQLVEAGVDVNLRNYHGKMHKLDLKEKKLYWIFFNFAVEAGAKHVYVVEASEMAEYARRLIAGNPSLREWITVIKGKVEDVELPEKAGILISGAI